MCLTAQVNCSVNAGVSNDYCLGVLSEFPLNGAISGDFEINSLEWKVVSQPTAANVVIDNPSGIITSAKIPNIPGSYVFSLNLTCGFGEATQQIVYEVFPEPQGELVFPEDFNCQDADATFLVEKISEEGTSFDYKFLEDGNFELISESDEFVIFSLNEGICFADSTIKIRYFVRNNYGCSILKETTIITNFKTEIKLNDFTRSDTCFILTAPCLENENVFWEIEDEPIPGSSYIVEPNVNPALLCGIAIGEYLIRLHVSNTSCIDTIIDKKLTVKLENETDNCDGIFLKSESLSFCPGTLPSTILLELDRPISANECIEWIQTIGPTVSIGNQNASDVILVGLSSGNSYSFEYRITDKLTDCWYYGEYQIYEYDNNNLQLISSQISFDNCPIEELGCIESLEISSKNGNDFSLQNATIELELISVPQEFDWNDRVNLYLLLNAGVFLNLEFDSIMQIQELKREILDFNNSSGLGFSVCGDIATGNYQFNVDVLSECFSFQEEIVIKYIKTRSTTSVNAGTDQILPCGQDSTTLVGNILGTPGNMTETGFWKVLKKPNMGNNPIQSFAGTQFLELNDLIPGIYQFEYSFPIVENTDRLCEFSFVKDQVNVWVPDVNNNFDLEFIDQQICLGEMLCIDIPIDLEYIEIISLDGISIEATLNDEDQVCFEDFVDSGVFEFSISVHTDCSISSDTMTITVTDQYLDPAQIISPDTCFTNIQNTRFLDLKATIPLTGDGIWKYEGTVNQINFSPSVIAPEVQVEFSRTDLIKFIWEVYNEGCLVQGDTLIAYDKTFSIFTGFDNIPAFIEDCDVEFPDTLQIGFNPASNIVDFEMELLSFTSNVDAKIEKIAKDSFDLIFFEKGVYYFLYRGKWPNACLDSGLSVREDFIEIRISDGAETAYAGEDIYQCTRTAFLNALAPENGTGLWTLISTTSPFFVIVQPNNPNTAIIMDRGEATLKWEVFSDDSFCSTSSFDEVKVSFSYFSIIEDSINLCGESGYLINHHPRLNLDVNIENVEGPSEAIISAINDTTSFISNLVPGTYYFEWTSITGIQDCDSEGSFIINVIAQSLDISDLSNIRCIEEDFSIQGIPLNFVTDEYRVNSISLIQKPLFAANGIDIIFNADSTQFFYDGFDIQGDYRFMIFIENGQCKFQTEFLVRINPKIEVELRIDSFLFCSKEEDFILELDTSGFGDLNVYWEPSDLFDDPTSFAPRYRGDKDTTVLVFIHDGAVPDMCNYSKEFNVIIGASLEINASSNPSVIMEGTSSQLSANIPLDSTCRVNWTPSNSLNSSSIENPIASPLLTTNYHIEVFKNGCYSFDQVLVEVVPFCNDSEVFFPNLFTPNGDGFNDQFEIMGDYESVYLEIYSRWGDKVYTIDDAHPTWNGTIDGKQANLDVYSYWAEVLYCNTQKKKYFGNITLLR